MPQFNHKAIWAMVVLPQALGFVQTKQSLTVCFCITYTTGADRRV